MSQVIHHGKTEQSSNTQGSYMNQQGLFQTDFEANSGCCAVQAIWRSTKKQAVLRIVDAVVGQGNLVQLMKNTSSIFPFQIERCPAVLSAQVHPSTVLRSLARSGLHGRVADKTPNLRCGNKAKRLNWARKHQKWAAEKWQQVLWTDESDESGTFMSVCRQQWSMVEVPYKFGTAFLQMELDIWSGLIVSSMLRNTGRYLSIMQNHQGGVWLAPNVLCIRTTTSLRTIFNLMENKKSWKWW